MINDKEAVGLDDEFCEALVNKLIRKITVFADHFTVKFKSGGTNTFLPMVHFTERAAFANTLVILGCMLANNLRLVHPDIEMFFHEVNGRQDG